MKDITFPKVGQGPAVVASDDDLQRDDSGFTHPNLHRRIDPQSPDDDSLEYHPREYSLGISSVNSYRTTTIHYHDEETTEDEIP